MKRAPMHASDRTKGTVPRQGYADPLPRARTRGVQLREVPCPDCTAEVGDPCLSANGKPLSSGHVSRQRMATRLDNERRAAEGTLTAADPFARKPGSQEDPHGPLCDTCGLNIRKVKNMDGRWVLAGHTKDGKAHQNHGQRCPGTGRLA